MRRDVADPTDAQLLSLVKAAMSGTLTRQAQQTQIAGRNITSFSLKELIDFRKYLEANINATGGARTPAVVETREAK